MASSSTARGSLEEAAPETETESLPPEIGGRSACGKWENAQPRTRPDILRPPQEHPVSGHSHASSRRQPGCAACSLLLIRQRYLQSSSPPSLRHACLAAGPSPSRALLEAKKRRIVFSTRHVLPGKAECRGASWVRAAQYVHMCAVYYLAGAGLGPRRCRDPGAALDRTRGSTPAHFTPAHRAVQVASRES